MITEEMLTTAAEEVADSMVHSISGEPHQFSPAFEKELRTLRRRAEHPVLHRVMRQVAAILMVVFTSFATLYAISPTVRGLATNWISQMISSHIQYSPLDTTPAHTEYNYFLPEAFDGYKLKETIDRHDSKFYVYFNEEGDMLCFEYIRGSSNTHAFLSDVEDYQYLRASVHSHPADIYIAPDGDQASVVFWQIVEENALLRLTAKENMDWLINAAEKVEKIPKN